jgi:hypothetical protein
MFADNKEASCLGVVTKHCLPNWSFVEITKEKSDIHLLVRKVLFVSSFYLCGFLLCFVSTGLFKVSTRGIIKMYRSTM